MMEEEQRSRLDRIGPVLLKEDEVVTVQQWTDQR
jgi:hypothetical protein